ncbi:major capsid protein [Sigmofec virus UA08Rod_4820]|uniref:Major capsid protein n=1 Tax=Sigmofec virus UA08Rod_4820 TaxID=2929410 RepID=A0A976N1A7_9VIRU|nr:major capsid protein [Sigmofec virus UA08Rod_4820]
MARSSFVSHVVNGYSRYDVPETKAFTCTPGVLYPVRIDFINARDRVRISQGIDVRSNPLAVPSFNPYTIRLHRFWVPLQLYHPEMRTNSSKFDMNNLSLNWLPAYTSYASSDTSSVFYRATSKPSNGLMPWLRMGIKRGSVYTIAPKNDIQTNLPITRWNNADTYLAYWDIVRNYYSYSQWGLYSIAWPGSYRASMPSTESMSFTFGSLTKWSYFCQRMCNLEYLDAYYESQFYPSAVKTQNNSYNRSNLFLQIMASDIPSGGGTGDGYPVAKVDNVVSTNAPTSSSFVQVAAISSDLSVPYYSVMNMYHPMAVVPSNPDRFSRLLPSGSTTAVSMDGVNTIPQLAIASRLQEYKDLLGAGGSRYSDWLETFFASKIEHVDRPKLLFSASQTVNVQVVMNQAGQNNFTSLPNGETTNPLGQQGGAIAFNSALGRSQSYYFREPGYLIDMLSIRPVYYWSDIKPDYLNYEGSDYFNSIYNDIGYQDVPGSRFIPAPSGASPATVAQEPCFNEFRSSYDEVLGMLALSSPTGATPNLASYWVQQRNWDNISTIDSKSYASALFVDMAQVNSPFAANAEDNFFVNMSYSVQKKSLVNKTFATRLSNR